jgi:hypothetical protein
MTTQQRGPLRTDQLRPPGDSAVGMVLQGTTLTIEGRCIVHNSLQYGSTVSDNGAKLVEVGTTTLTAVLGSSTNITAASGTFVWRRSGTRYHGNLHLAVTPTAGLATYTILVMSGLPGISSNFAAATRVSGSGVTQGTSTLPEVLEVSAVPASQTFQCVWVNSNTGATNLHATIIYTV